jgi:hypothetical protein
MISVPSIVVLKRPIQPQLSLMMPIRASIVGPPDVATIAASCRILGNHVSAGIWNGFHSTTADRRFEDFLFAYLPCSRNTIPTSSPSTRTSSQRR